MRRIALRERRKGEGERKKEGSKEGKEKKKKENNGVAGHVSPDRHEIYFADSAHGTIVLPKERIGRRTVCSELGFGLVKGSQAAGWGEGSGMEVNPLTRIHGDSPGEL